jgi:hypothetical protein
MWDFCFKLMKIRVKTISVTTACYNEEGNVEELCQRVRAVMASIGRDNYEHIFIDNASRPYAVERDHINFDYPPGLPQDAAAADLAGSSNASIIRPSYARPSRAMGNSKRIS